MNQIDKLIEVAKAELGYLEKKTNSQLDSKTANAGQNNYTKYADEVDKTDLNNGKKNGFAWCAIFVQWCFLQAFGLAETKRLLCLPNKSLAASVDYFSNYFKAKGQLYTTPKKGDIVFFGTQHTGLVIDVNGNSFTTIEGNTSSGDNNVVSNGGGVFKKNYTVKSTYKFGRPNYTDPNTEKMIAISVPQLKVGSKNNSVKVWQMLLNYNGCNCGNVDGDFGSNTENQTKQWQKKNNLSADGVVGKDSWTKMLN